MKVYCMLTLVHSHSLSHSLSNRMPLAKWASVASFGTPNKTMCWHWPPHSTFGQGNRNWGSTNTAPYCKVWVTRESKIERERENINIECFGSIHYSSTVYRVSIHECYTMQCSRKYIRYTFTKRAANNHHPHDKRMHVNVVYISLLICDRMHVRTCATINALHNRLSVCWHSVYVVYTCTTVAACTYRNIIIYNIYIICLLRID